jgi:hypothetical protein
MAGEVEVVAPPGRPGHAGVTPQNVGLALRRSRLRGIESSGVVAALVDLAQPIVRFLGGPTPNPQNYGHVSTQHSLAAADEFARREQQLAPWLAEPVSKWPGMTGPYLIGRLPLPFESDREQAARQRGIVEERSGGVVR